MRFTLGISKWVMNTDITTSYKLRRSVLLLRKSRRRELYRNCQKLRRRIRKEQRYGDHGTSVCQEVGCSQLVKFCWEVKQIWKLNSFPTDAVTWSHQGSQQEPLGKAVWAESRLEFNVAWIGSGVGNGDRTFRQFDRDRRKTKHGMAVGRGRAVKYPHDGDRDSLRGGEASVQQSKRDHQLREILKRKVDFKGHMGTFFFFTSWKVGRMGGWFSLPYRQGV